MATIANSVWQELINQGIVRDPRTAGSLPPAWRQPIEGTPAPGEGSDPVAVGPDAVVGIDRTGGIAPDRFEAEWVQETVDVWVRTRRWPDAESLWFSIRRALTDKYGWLMAGLRVIESRELNAFALIDRSRAQGFSGRATLLFQTYTEDH